MWGRPGCRGAHAPSNGSCGGRLRVVDVGSVSNPSGKDRRASYALLEASAAGYEVSLHRVEYNRSAVMDAIRRTRYPAAADLWLLSHFADRPGSPATGVAAGAAP